MTKHDDNHDHDEHFTPTEHGAALMKFLGTLKSVRCFCLTEGIEFIGKTDLMAGVAIEAAMNALGVTENMERREDSPLHTLCRSGGIFLAAEITALVVANINDFIAGDPDNPAAPLTDGEWDEFFAIVKRSMLDVAEVKRNPLLNADAQGNA